MMVRSTFPALALLASVAPTNAIDLDPNSSTSIKNAAATIAYGLLSAYNGNVSSTTAPGVFGSPYYWWESGAIWGSLISYSVATNDTSYNPTVTQALLAQVGSNNDYQNVNYTKTLGNEDQAFWALAAMDAVELGYPATGTNVSWLQIVTNVWNLQALRWDTAKCNGGLKWQIFPFNAGYNYKQTASNALFFQMSARLARYTGNATYADWASKTWDWMSTVGLIDSSYRAFDGTDDNMNCSEIDKFEWSYNNGALLYGAATLYDYTNSSSKWRDVTRGLLNNSVNTWTVQDGGNKILSEVACEGNTPNNCNPDMIPMKGFLARWLARSALLVPEVKEQAYSLIRASSIAAAKTCGGGNNNATTCGLEFTGDTDGGRYPVSQNLAAFDTVQSLLFYNSTNIRILKQSDPASNSNGGGSSNATTGSSTQQNTTTGSTGGTGAGSTLTVGYGLFTIMLAALALQELL